MTIEGVIQRAIGGAFAFCLLSLASCQTGPTEPIIKSPKASPEKTVLNPVWKTPAVSYEKFLPDGKSAIYYMSFTSHEDVPITRRHGYIFPLGKVISEEILPPQAFGPKMSSPIRRVIYEYPDNKTKRFLAYEVQFPECEFDEFSLYISDMDQPNAVAALDYVLGEFDFHSEFAFYSECDAIVAASE